MLVWLIFAALATPSFIEVYNYESEPKIELVKYEIELSHESIDYIRSNNIDLSKFNEDIIQSKMK